MQNISAVIIDTYENRKMSTIATKMVGQTGNIETIHTLSTAPYGIAREKFHSIPEIKSSNDYSSIALEDLDEIIATDHFLIFQWDGFPIHPENWQDEFLSYDYIGSPDGSWVGNGGFSLRSKKLLRAIKRLGIKVDKSNPFIQTEDILICHHYRPQLENVGIKFAPASVAEKFSFDALPYKKPVFGFHGPGNFPLILQEAQLIKLLDDIIERIPNPPIMKKFIANCLSQGMIATVEILMNDFQSKPQLLNTYYFEAANNPHSPLLKLFEIGSPLKIKN